MTRRNCADSTGPTPFSATDDVYQQLVSIDKALANAMACLALGHTHDMLMHLVRAQSLSHSLNFRLEAELLPPGSARPVSTLQPFLTFDTPQPSPAQQALL